MQQKTENQWTLMLVLGTLMAVTSLATDIYLPALPTMERELHGNAELTITGFLIGFALGQLVWGPISDRIGRKLPIIIGMALFTAGSIGCALSTSMEQIVFWRVFQALRACTGPMLARAMIRDQFVQSRAAQILSTLTLIMAVAPIVAPLVGGQIVKWTSWHWNFWLLTLLALLLFYGACRLTETLPAEKRSRQSWLATFGSYIPLFKQSIYLRYVLCVTFFYVGMYAFITASPMIYIGFFGVPEQYFGFLFGLNIVGIMIVTTIAKPLIKRYGINRLLSWATLIASASAICLAVVAYFQVDGIVAVAGFVFLFYSMTGVISSCCTAGALAQVEPAQAGTASALLGALQYGSGIISSILLALFADGTAFTMAWIIAAFALLSKAMLVGLTKGKL